MSSFLPRLRYFQFPGRAYAARIALYNALGKDGWVDERLTQGAFKKLKSQALEDRSLSYGAVSTSTQLATNNLPQLILAAGSEFSNSSSEDLVITQSHAIARWAGRLNQQGDSAGDDARYRLYPDDSDLLSALLVDETMALVDSMVAFAPKDEDKEVRLQKRIAYSHSETGLLRLGFAHLESRLAAANGGSSNGGAASASSGAFLLGLGLDKLSVADLYLKKPLTDMIADGQFEAVEKDYVQKHFPRVFDHAQMVAEHPLVKDYGQHYKN